MYGLSPFFAMIPSSPMRSTCAKNASPWVSMWSRYRSGPAGGTTRASNAFRSTSGSVRRSYPSSDGRSNAYSVAGDSTAARRMSSGRRIRARCCRRWKFGWPLSSSVTTSPSMTAFVIGSARSDRTTSGKDAERSRPLREKSLASVPLRSASTLHPSSLSSNTHPALVNGFSLVSHSISLMSSALRSAFLTFRRSSSPVSDATTSALSRRRSTDSPDRTDSGGNVPPFSTYPSRSLIRSHSFSPFLSFTRVHMPLSL